MVKRRNEEDPLAAQFERPDLEDHRDRLENENASDNNKEQFLLEHHRQKTEGSSERQSTGVPHEDLRRMAVEPQKPEPRTDQSGGENRKLASFDDVGQTHPSTRGGVRRKESDDGKRQRDQHGTPHGQSVETVREIHRIGCSHDDKC